MPGLIGFVVENNDIDPVALLNRMIKAVMHKADYRVENFTAKEFNFSMGLVRHPFMNRFEHIVESQDGNLALAFDGEVYSKDSGKGDAEWLLERFLSEGEKALEKTQGVFVGCLLDKKEERLLLFNDKFGLKPIYYSLWDGNLVFGGEIKAILQFPGIRKEMDLQALSDCFHYGFVLGDKTLFKDIRLLPPGSILEYRFEEKLAGVRSYWHLASLFEPGARSGGYDEVVHLFIRGVRKRLGQKEHLGISLSGGLDSRGILAALKDAAQGMPSYTLGLKGCQDERLSRRMADLIGTRHEFVEITENDLREFKALAETLIYLSDGMYFPHESTERVAMNYFKKAPFKILFRGHGGEIAKAALAYPVQVTKEALSYKSGEKSKEFIYKSANLVKRDIPIKEVFTPEFQQAMEEGARVSLDESLRDVEGSIFPPDLMIYFYINEHIRRQVVASLEIFRSEIEVRLPYLDEDFLSELLRLPIEKRYEGEVHIEIIKKTAPRLMKIPNSNTGAPLDAGSLRLFLTDKFNSLMKRLSFRGYRHYTEYERWQREYFREGIESILFDKKTLERGIFLESGLRAVFNAHISGKKNYAHFLGTAVGIEIWFRKFVD